MLASLLLALATADVGEIALIPDVGGQIQQSIPVGSRYLEKAGCAFFQTHDDQYDVIFVFTTTPLNMFWRTQEGWALRVAAMGIGRDGYFDTTSRFCTSRLKHAVKMGDIGSFTDDPDATYTGEFGFTLSGVQLMGHEFGHYWLAAATFDKGDGQRHCLLRGFTAPDEAPLMPVCDGYRNSDFNLHWSYYFNTGSVMYGNVIEDLGGGQFLLSSPSPKYSELDQYLMGLRDPQEVSPMFLVDTGELSRESTGFPVVFGQTEMITGERLDFTIQDVIRAEGPRVPPREECHWKAAFLLLHDENTTPTAAEIARVDLYRQRWESFYVEATDRRGSMDTTLAGTGAGTVECPATGIPPVMDAGSADAFLELDAGSLADASVPDSDVDVADAAMMPAMPGEDAAVTPTDDGGPRVLFDDGCACSASRSKAGAGWFLLFVLFALQRGARRIASSRPRLALSRTRGTGLLVARSKR